MNINGESFNGTSYHGYFGRFDLGAEVITASSELDSPYSVVFPNPANHFITIQSPVSLERLTLHDQSGRAVMNLNSQALIQTLDVSHLSSGIYFLSIHNQKGELSRRKIVLD